MSSSLAPCCWHRWWHGCRREFSAYCCRSYAGDQLRGMFEWGRAETIFNSMCLCECARSPSSLSLACSPSPFLTLTPASPFLPFHPCSAGVAGSASKFFAAAAHGVASIADVRGGEGAGGGAVSSVVRSLPGGSGPAASTISSRTAAPGAEVGRSYLVCHHIVLICTPGYCLQQLLE